MVDTVILPPISVGIGTARQDQLGYEVFTFTPTWYESLKNITDAVNLILTAPTGVAGGDLSGTYPNPTVVALNGVALGSTTATSGNLLIANGTLWQSVSSSGDATISSSGVFTLGSNVVTNAKFRQSSANSLVGNPTAGSANVQDISLGATLGFSGTALQTTAITGDVTASANSFVTTVVKIQNVAVNATNATAVSNLTGVNSGDQSIFQTIAVSGQSNVVADSTTDTLTIAAGSGIVVTTNATTDTVTIASSITQYTDELAQDSVGTILTDSSTIDFTYDDATPSITAIVKDASITEAKQVLADNATHNASTSMHGYLKKLSNTSTEYMDGTGNWSVPAGGGGGTATFLRTIALMGC